jgi:hypothetical protein
VLVDTPDDRLVVRRWIGDPGLALAGPEIVEDAVSRTKPSAAARYGVSAESVRRAIGGGSARWASALVGISATGAAVLAQGADLALAQRHSLPGPASLTFPSACGCRSSGYRRAGLQCPTGHGLSNGLEPAPPAALLTGIGGPA